MGSTLGREGKIDFDAEAEQVRCSASMLNYLQTGVVTGDEQISDTHEHTHTHRPLGAPAMCGMSHRGGLIFSGWEIT